MNQADLEKLVKEIVAKASILKDKYIDEKNAPVNYCCVFAQNDNEFDILVKAVKEIGDIIKNTPTGPLFRISPIDTVLGNLNY